MKASGEFQIDLQALEPHVKGSDGIELARMSIAKKYEGQLNASSQGEMLSVKTSIEGSAGYVALEQVRGELDGHAGSFVLQHYGTVNKGSDHLVLEVVPNSGSGQLAGLSGSMLILIDHGTHLYEFNYELN